MSDQSAVRHDAETAGQTHIERRNWLDSADCNDVLRTMGEAVYRWTMDSDHIEWSKNAARVIGVDSQDAISTGKRYAALLSADSPANRYDAITADDIKDQGEGVPFRVLYCLKTGAAPDDGERWIEDAGLWFADERGNPSLVVGAVRAATQRHAQERHLDFLSRHDSLTGQLNRYHLIEKLRTAIGNARETQSTCAFLIAAIDNLAVVNDTYGFDVADHVIARVGKRLAKRLRGGDSIGRLSGNKFGLVLNDCSQDDMRIASSRLLATIQDDAIITELGAVSVSISVGGVLAPRHAPTSSLAIARAHEALDRRRRNRCNTFTIYQPNDRRDEQRKRNIVLADAIVRGLNERKFRFAFQPIVVAATGEIAYHECLLRLDKPGGSGEKGGALIAVAERLGLIRLIDHRVLDLSFDILDRHPDANLSINVSAESVADPSWLTSISAMLARRPNKAERLIVELTESTVVRHVADATRFIGHLKDLGVKTAIDDFGAGYTSFRALKDLSVDLVKIDGSFVNSLGADGDDEVFVRALVDIAKTLGLQTVAEWVRDAETVDKLKGFGVDYFQGEFFGLASTDTPWQGCPDDKTTRVAPRA